MKEVRKMRKHDKERIEKNLGKIESHRLELGKIGCQVGIANEHLEHMVEAQIEAIEKASGEISRTLKMVEVSDD